ncbi:hypothetical protein RJ640_021585 [Escallonia rubra]|uniref:Reverse transcriptase Ty1/copia-type domain-containing protein n=1 Tax=Escallonia rubra TaxID=112253 RepID=A0AA88SG57_9ASTE|nr:hypothetical protein RJ640_021585 [Escallonia rubra]
MDDIDENASIEIRNTRFWNKKVKIKLAAATDEVEENVVALEVAIEVDVVHAVYAVDEDVVDNLLKEAKQSTAIKHIVVVEDLEAEEEVDFNNEELFTDLDETIKGEVTFGDSSKIPMKGKGMFTNFKKAMTKEFEMTDIGEMSYFLGVEVKQMEDGIFMSQKKYAEQILSRFRMKDCNPVAIPAETDSNYGRDLDDRKSISGYAFHIGSAIFSWSSKKQQIVALSTCEAEYIAAAACTCQAIWLKNILKELYLIEEGPTMIYVDNKSAIALAKNPV